MPWLFNVDFDDISTFYTLYICGHVGSCKHIWTVIVTQRYITQQIYTTVNMNYQALVVSAIIWIPVSLCRRIKQFVREFGVSIFHKYFNYINTVLLWDLWSPNKFGKPWIIPVNYYRSGHFIFIYLCVWIVFYLHLIYIRNIFLSKREYDQETQWDKCKGILSPAKVSFYLIRI